MSTSTILDQYGNPWKFAHAADTRRTRGPQFPTRTGDFDALIPSSDLTTLRSLSNRLYTNMGIPRAAINQKADYAVGSAFLPKYTGPSDFDDGRQIAAFLQKSWFPRCDVRGGIYDWWKLLELSSIAIDRDGDVFWLLVRGSDGYPRIQQIPAHRVGNGGDYGTVTSGKWKGRKIVDGVIQTGEGRALAYRILTGEDMRTPVDIDAQSVIHILDPTAARQSRGLPAFTHALEDLRACIASTADERIRQQIISRLHLTVFNDSGGPDTDDPFITMTQSTGDCQSLVTMEEIHGGIRYFKAGGNERMEQMKQDNPGDVWEAFQDRMIRMAIAGVGWSYSLVWKPAGQGTAERAEVLKARRAISRRQRDLAHAARRALAWAYSVFVEQGKVPLLDHPFAWEFSSPPRLSVDDGRESKMEIEEWRSGLRNLSEITEARGITEDEFYMIRAHSVAKRKVAARDIGKEYGVEITPIEMAMTHPNELFATVQEKKVDLEEEQMDQDTTINDDEDSND
jgi:capsid protein